MNTWFTSDNHFGHKRIIELALRPFADVAAMDRAMIEAWNLRVKRDDVVFHLGDFAFADHADYAPHLNGQKRLIRGNHDHKNRMRRECWHTIDDLLHVTIQDTNLVLCHYGMRVWNKSHHGAIHLYGHSHGNLPGDRQSCDVGVDAWGFQPVSLDEIKARLATLPRRAEPDHHIAATTE